MNNKVIDISMGLLCVTGLVLSIINKTTNNTLIMEQRLFGIMGMIVLVSAGIKMEYTRH